MSALLAYALCTILLTLPLPLNVATNLPAGGDPFKHTWRIGWEVHQLLTAPLDLYRANSFYLYPDSFAFDDSMLTPGLMTMPIVLITTNLVLAHNLALLSSYALSGYTMFLFAFYLTRSARAAWVAGLLFAFNTFRLSHYAHMNLLMVQWLPLFFLAIDKMLWSVRSRLVLLMAVAVVLQGLSSLMVLYLMLIAAVPYILVRVLTTRLPGRKTVAQFVLAGLLAGVMLLPFALPYYRISRDENFVRDFETVEALSATVNSYLTVVPQNWVWSRILEPFTHKGNYPHEHRLFMGLTALGLSALGIVSARARGVAMVFSVVGLCALVLSFGPTLYISATEKIGLPFALPYDWLYEWLPGFASLRAGARFAIIVSFAVASLATLGMGRLIARIRPRFRNFLVALVSGFVLLENLATPLAMQAAPVGAEIPPVYRWLATQPPHSVIAELPVGDESTRVMNLGRYQYLSAYHFQPILTAAYFSYYPPSYGSQLAFLARFPSPEALAFLREFEVRYVVIHLGALIPKERATMRKQIKKRGIRLVQQFGNDLVLEVPRGEQDLSPLRAEFYAASLTASKSSPMLYALITNPVDMFYFFRPDRFLVALVNGERVQFSLPLYIERGTTILDAPLNHAPELLNVTAAPNSAISFSAQQVNVLNTPNQSARLVALQWVGGRVAPINETRVAVELEWSVRARIHEVYRVQVIARNQANAEVARTTAVHPAPENPTARWRPGETLKDKLELSVSPNQKLTFEIRLYEPSGDTMLIPLDANSKPLPDLRLGE